MALTQVKSDGIADGAVTTNDLSDSGVTAGTYGSSSAIPAITVDAKGRITSASTNAISVESDRIFEGNTSAEAVDTGSDGHFKVITEGTEALRVDSSQQVGIGTNAPAAKLDVSGNVQFGDGGGFDMNANGSRWQFSLAGTERMRITTSGRLGIGTQSPSATLHVKGGNGNAIHTDNDGSQYSGLEISNNGTAKAYVQYDNTNALYKIGSRGSAPIQFLVSDIERVRIDSSGRLGIGTSSPAYKCDIDVTGSALRLNSTTTQALLVISSDNAANAKIEFGDESDNDRGAITYDNPNNALIFQANAAERLRIANTGAFGLSGANYGTSGQVLTSNGSGSAPSWQTVTSGVGTIRAWVNFHGQTDSIRDSGNVSSIGDNGTGLYTINFTSSLASANYAWSGSSDSGRWMSLANSPTYSTSAITVRTLDWNGNSYEGTYASFIAVHD
jgi:hypothetical protein